MNTTEDTGQPEVTISGLTCSRSDVTTTFTMTFTNMLDEHIALYEVQVYATLSDDDPGPDQVENVGAELGVGGTYEGTFQAYVADNSPDTDTYYIDVIYDDEQGDTFVEQHIVIVIADADDQLTASPPKFIERFAL